MFQRIFIFICLTFFAFALKAQDFRAIDYHALQAPKKIEGNFQKLTDYLASDFEYDLYKVRSFYTWIIHHIDYDNAAYKKGNKRLNRSNTDILRRRKAICFGYSSLFKSMCQSAGIPVQIVNGYVKNNGSVDLSRISHSWNAVQIDSVWYLIDLTWANGRMDSEDFFLSNPNKMIQTHLPADPMWQLLPCPVNAKIFRQAYVTPSKDTCYNFRDSLIDFSQLNPIQQRIKSAERSYRFHPIEENKIELGHLYFDQAGLLMDQAEELTFKDSIDQLKGIYQQVLFYGGKAAALTELFQHQKENLAYAHINYTVALSREFETTKDQKALIEEMQNHLDAALKILDELPANFFSESARDQIKQYQDWLNQ